MFYKFFITRVLLFHSSLITDLEEVLMHFQKTNHGNQQIIPKMLDNRLFLYSGSNNFRKKKKIVFYFQSRMCAIY